jgi:hypothetical protein
MGREILYVLVRNPFRAKRAECRVASRASTVVLQNNTDSTYIHTYIHTLSFACI